MNACFSGGGSLLYFFIMHVGHFKFEMSGAQDVQIFDFFQKITIIKISVDKKRQHILYKLTFFYGYFSTFFKMQPHLFVDYFNAYLYANLDEDFDALGF